MTTYNDQAETEIAKTLHVKLAAVNITEIDVKTMERNIPRKEQAKMARQLFSKLGLKGISVTAPNYSMAQSVDVRFPRRRDYTVRDEAGFVDHPKDPASQENSKARQRIEAILLAAFPNSDNRSDSMTDYFDYRWSIS